MHFLFFHTSFTRIVRCLVRLLPVFAVCFIFPGCEGRASEREGPRATGPYADRQNATLLELASRFEPSRSYSSSRGDSLTMGRQSSYLVATIALHERGLDGGLSPSEAAPEIKHLAEVGMEYIGTDYNNPGPWSWVNNGSPGIMHSVMNLGYVLNRWGPDLPADTRETVIQYLSEGAFFTDTEDDYLFNARTNEVVGKLLAGEFLGYQSDLWEGAVEQFDNLYHRTMNYGGIEMNSPIYSAYVFPALMLLTDLEHPTYKQKARILLDYKLMIHGHLYLPGGGLGAPRHRERAGGGGGRFPDAVHAIYYLLFGDGPYTSPTGSFHMVGAASGYAPSPIIESIFMDKGDGYHFSAWTHGIHQPRNPTGVYPFVEDSNVAPWSAVVAPDGDVMFGFNYGSRVTAITVSSGLMARGSDGGFHTLYQYQPAVSGDTTESMRSSGRPILIGGGSDPDDYTGELYDFERMLYGNTYLSIWDPTLYHKEDWAVRQHQYTVTRLPKWNLHGGEMEESASGWFVGRMGNTYIAYRPLGPLLEREERTDSFGEHHFLKMEGRSGGIIELATPDQFSTLADYIANLDDRFLEFDRDPDSFAVEFDALEPGSSDTVRVRLEYRPERRFIDGDEESAEELLNHGFINSPWVDWDAATRRIEVSRAGYPTTTYDLANGTITEER